MVDYIIATPCVLNVCSDFEIGDRIESVQFPVICEFGQKSPKSDDFEGIGSGQTFSRFKWNEEKKMSLYINLEMKCLHFSVFLMPHCCAKYL